ncbi:MAG: SLAC1 anion channel family protein [Gammaproteobacteria bacterium]|nr:SLAC1 anion channel family protein [Gammaproteobacteria bacterium]MBU1723287.1 SLAC1 anion channel family protein [Gammaproteobacteria bacterium]MBU2006582.1 SLAC1 anion channel family protein [Gammaproteobacteria bacterium]
MENVLTQPNSRLAFFPISFFAMVMGLSGLTIAWEKAQHVFNMDLGINPLLVGLTATIFIAFAIAYATKALMYRESVRKEIGHPVKLSFFPTISISLLLLAVAFMEFDMGLSRILWMLGAGLHLFFTLFVINTWMHHEHFQIQHINPAWFIPAVGNVLVPIAGMPLGFTDVSWFFFSVGMLFWGILMTIIFYRILFHTPLDARLLPTLFILIAPPAVGFIAYTKLTGGELDSFARFLYFSGLFLTLLLFSQFNRFAKLQFALSWWAYSFPTAAITIASFVMYEKLGKAFYLWLGTGLLTILSVLVTALFVRTAMAAYKGKICTPEH